MPSIFRGAPALLGAAALLGVAASAVAAPSGSPASPALPVGSTPPLIESERVFRPKADAVGTLVARGATVAAPELGGDAEIELRAFESFGLGFGYLVDDHISSGYLRLVPVGLAINHYVVSGFVDFFFDHDMIRYGGTFAIPLYRIADLPADLSLQASLSTRHEAVGQDEWGSDIHADTTELAIGLEYALW